MLKIKNAPLYILIFILVFSCSKSDSNDTKTEMPPPPSTPTLTTAAIKEITQKTAISGGNVTDDGNANVTSRGVCWGTLANPTIADSKSSDGSGQGEFSSSITNLEANTTYYLRSYATNSEGTAYGSELSFETLAPEPVAKVFEGDLILTSQQEVDDFGQQEYTMFLGNLIIQDINNPSTIQDLNPLRTLIEINGSLIIQENTILQKIEGFDLLENISENLVIILNDNLALINSFEKLESIGGSLRLANVQESSGAIEGFENLRSIGGGLNFRLVNGIQNLTFFESLENVNGIINLSFNSLLESLQGLEKLSAVGEIELWANISLSSLSGLQNVHTVDGDLIINTNIALENILDLGMLKNISNGKLSISGNSKLISLKGLDNLRTIGEGIEIFNNNSLESLEGLDSLEATGVGTTCIICLGRIRIESNEKLLNVDALENLTTAWYGGIDVKNNISLENLDGFRNLVNIYKFPSDSGGLTATISGNSNLNDVCGLKTVLDNNPSRYFLVGNNNGTTIYPLGGAQDLLRECD